jgi:hypothetical protein
MSSGGVAGGVAEEDAVQAVEQCAPQEAWVGARPRRRCGWCAVDGSVAMMMRLLLRQNTTDEGAGWCGAAVGLWTSSATALTR